MIKKILLLLFALIAGVLGYVAIQPSEYLIAREILIKASPDVIFPFINNPKKVGEWMPWKEMDPHVQVTYEGPEEGIGSKSVWNSPGKMGIGEALVVESNSGQNVKTLLNYVKPMPMSQMAEITLNESASGTIVQWSVTGKNNFMGRLYCIFQHLDQMIGDHFEAGLANLKNYVESRASK
jgi:hypothetical protein